MDGGIADVEAFDLIIQLSGMQVFAAVNLITDEPHWIKREDFYRYFDQKDFLDREVQEVQPAYLNDWFHTSKDGKVEFYIPVVGVSDGKTDLIGTRHRLAVLLLYLDLIPIAFAMGFLLQEDARRFLATIPKRPLDLSEPLWIPDLPIKEKLP
jgi:hypothetical protein